MTWTPDDGPAGAPSLAPGVLLAHYRVIEKIGQGGMGAIYRARDEHLNRDVALKVLSDHRFADDAARRRLRQEADVLSRLNHPNIATVYDFDSQSGIDFLVVELVAGSSLREDLRSAPFDDGEILRLATGLADGLAAAHDAGVMHRDLKPENICLTAERRVKILDFGLARAVPGPVETATTADTGVVGDDPAAGTLPYMAPEELRGVRDDPRSDIHAFGVILYEMATGRRPHDESVATALVADIQVTAPPPPRTVNGALSPAVESVVLRCLEKDPALRYQTGGDLLADLRRLAALSSVSIPLSPAPHRRRWLPVAGLSALVLLAVAAVVLFLGLDRNPRGGSGEGGGIESIAVLPLENLSGDAAQDYFADGLTEALIADLARSSTLRVISRTSVMRYRDTDRSLPEIARELGVDAVVLGSVIRQGDRVRISAQLVHATTDRHLWAETYERRVGDVLTLQSEVARRIALSVDAALEPRGRDAGDRFIQPEALEAYLKGRYYWNRRGPDDLRRSVRFFRQAVERAPDYAEAHAGMANAYNLLGSYDYMPPDEAYGEARAAAAEALRLDADLAEAHVALAWVRESFDWDWRGADDEYIRALALQPGDATARHWYALHLAWLDRLDEALVEIERARSLDPLSLIINANVGWLLYFDHRFGQAAGVLEKVRQMEPGFLTARHKLGKVYTQLGRHDEAVAEFQAALDLSGGTGDPTILAHALARAGRVEEARGYLDDREQRWNDGGEVSAHGIGLIHLALGNVEIACTWLQRAVDKRESYLISLQVDPDWDDAREAACFASALSRMEFPAPQRTGNRDTDA